MAKYPYIVNKDGVWYPAGAEVPADKAPETNDETADAEETEETVRRYSKTDINRMPVAELKQLATEVGIVSENAKGEELKSLLISHFGL